MRNFLLGVFLTAGVLGTSAYALNDCCSTGDQACCKKQTSCCKGKMTDKVNFIRLDNKNMLSHI